jgi:hypothetical protein
MAQVCLVGAWAVSDFFSYGTNKIFSDFNFKRTVDASTDL